MLAVWTLLALTALAVLVTYSRLPPEKLYHTSVDGLAGGLGRALVVVNFPVALVAIAIVLVCAGRGRGGLVTAASWLAVGLCLVVVVPGVVDQDDLDARWVNALPGLGVAIAAGLTWLARPGLSWSPRAPGDRIRLVLAAVLLVGAIPWVFAETGFYAPDPILADEVPSGETIAAVHLGHHHGTDGVLLALSALLLSRTLGSLVALSHKVIVSFYLALMLAYGAANAAQDFWLEQVVKRGWTERGIPS
ncbi:MAG: hypothetical protein ACRDNX_08140, partial [Gaiellaceae bacterium]